MLPALLYFATALTLLAVFCPQWGRRGFGTTESCPTLPLREAPLSRHMAVVLLLLPLAFTARTLLTGRLMAPVDIQYLSEPFYGVKNVTPYNPEMLDVATQMVPWRAAVRESLQHGQWPLLNPHTLCGDILAPAAQPAAYSPFTLIACLMPPAESFNYTGAIAFFLAALGTFLFARDLGCNEPAALFGAVAFAFNGPLAFAILWPLGFSWALLPLVMLGARRIVREPGARSVSLLTTALVLEILAGHPESVLHVITLGAVWGVFEISAFHPERGRRWGGSEGSKAGVAPMLLSPPHDVGADVPGGPLPNGYGQPGRSWRASGTRIVGALLAGALAVGLTAIYLLPVLDAADQTVEHRFRQAVFATSKRAAPANEIAAGALTSLFPFLHQQKWLAPMRTPAFIGIGSLVLVAAIACVARARSATTWMLLALFAVCAAAALMAPPVSSFLHALPLFDVALNERLLFGASFCAAMLAARGLTVLGWRTTAIVFALLAVGSYVVMHAGLTDGNVTKFRQYALLGELAPLFLTVLVCRWTRDDLRWIALVALLLSQRVMEDGRWYPALPRDIAFPPLALPQSGDRIVGRGMTFLPNTSAVYQVDDVRGYEAMTLRSLAETYPLWADKIPIWFNRVDDLAAPMLSMMNVRWALTSRGDGALEGWRAVRPGLLENTRALPRAFVPHHVRLGTPRALVLPEMRGETDFAERAWIGSEGEAPSRFVSWFVDKERRARLSLSETATEAANGPGVITGEIAEMQNDGYVVVSQANWRGWRAWVDGRRVPVYRANHAFLAVFVPRGRHTLRIAFRPASFTIGRAVTGATLLILTVIVLVHRRRGTILAPG